MLKSTSLIRISVVTIDKTLELVEDKDLGVIISNAKVVKTANKGR